jgi:hypothetical protein
MNSFIDISKEHCEYTVKYNQKGMKYQLLWMMFVLCMTVFEGQTLISHPNILQAIIVGMMIVTSLWTIFYFLESRLDLKNEKRKLKFLTDLHNTQLASQDYQHYKDARTYYQQLGAQIINDHPELKDKYVSHFN